MLPFGASAGLVIYKCQLPPQFQRVCRRTTTYAGSTDNELELHLAALTRTVRHRHAKQVHAGIIINPGNFHR